MLDLQEPENFNITILKETNEEVVVDPLIAEQERQAMIQPIKEFSILVIDHMVTNLQAIKKMLDLHYDLKLENNYDEAVLDVKRGYKPDLVIFDMSMLGPTGSQPIDELKSIIRFKVPFLMEIENSNTENLKKCKKAGGDGYVVRPYKPTYFRAEVRRLLTGRNVAE
jgi:PleD family two-component response regulator